MYTHLFQMFTSNMHQNEWFQGLIFQKKIWGDAHRLLSSIFLRKLELLLRGEVLWTIDCEKDLG